MEYREKIQELTKHIDSSLADFSVERVRGRKPTQISSEFLTNKEQGDWAEKTLLSCINNNSSELIAVRYGKNDDINAGDEGFDEFFEAYQKELDTIGKRPDILIFNKKDFPYKTNDDTDISGFSDEILDALVPKAKCGIEVRSSAFLIDKYESYMNDKVNNAINTAMTSRNIILNNYKELLISKDEALYDIVENISPENIHVISFHSPSWGSSKELSELSDELRKLKKSIKLIPKRNSLSITPKVEDLKVVYTWVQKYNFPHYYIQVFFDKAYGISFEKILTLIGDSSLENREYFIEKDVKNQGKTTIKINATKEHNILEKIYLPEHYSEMKELNRGRLLFYVKFKDSISVINKEEFEKLIGIKLV